MAPESLPFAALYDALRAQGHALDLVPPGEWVPRARAALGRASPAAPILDQLQELDLARLDAMHFVCAGDETFARLPPDDLDALRVTPALFAQYLRAYSPAES